MSAIGARFQPALLACVSVATVLLAGCAPSDPLGLDVEYDLDPVERPEVVRGIYVNAQAAGSPTHLASLLDLTEDSRLNTFVVDVKERGEVSYTSSVALVDEVGAGRSYIPDLEALLRTLRNREIYPIARIVVFRDAILAQARPEWAIRTTDGGVWLDPESDKPWVDPYNADVWAYNIALAREALEAGFAEIQWDYVRFPDVSSAERATMVHPAQSGRSSSEAIHEFIQESRTELAEFEAPITADVFGRVISVVGDDGIGQDWDRLVRVTDVLLPMVYPALYWPGSFGVPDPNAEPYRLVRAALDSAVVRLDRTDGASATLRPWLQAFTLGGPTYGAQQIRDQIRAADEAGVEEWLFWNPDGVYPTGVF